MLYILLSGSPPFDGQEDADIIKNVQKGKYDIKTGPWKSISNEAKQVVEKMLTYDYKHRPFAKSVLDDPWFKDASHEPYDVDLMKECFKNLKEFNATKKLQAATMALLAKHSTTKEETARL